MEVYERVGSGPWTLREALGVESEVRIPGIDITLPLGEIYDRVEFDSSPFPGNEGVFEGP